MTFISALFLALFVSSQSVPCTFHDYEGSYQTYGIQLDNNPPYCGERYSVLNVARIVATSFMEPNMCNQCIQIFGSPGHSLYVLAVDKREAFGLDIAGSSFQALFPESNILDPQTCTYQIVDPSFCGSICAGSAEECTPGVKNNLIASLLPPASQNFIGLSVTPVQQAQFSPVQSSTTEPVQQVQFHQETQSVQESTLSVTITSSSTTSSVSETSSSATSETQEPTTSPVTGSSSNLLGSGSSIQDNRYIITSAATSISGAQFILISICISFIL